MADQHPFKSSVEDAEVLLRKTLEVAKGKSPNEAGIDTEWMETFGKIAERVETEQRWDIMRYLFQAADTASAFLGGTFDNK